MNFSYRANGTMQIRERRLSGGLGICGSGSKWLTRTSVKPIE